MVLGLRTFGWYSRSVAWFVAGEALFLLHLVEELDGFGVRQTTFSCSDRQQHIKHVICHLGITYIQYTEYAVT